ncbi:heterokaryon incompatibility protein-domain-containing protein [Dactylonectria macrodidyma]|uniref:Heterokaryon incompatibility protein-domain-containing protein n=1 Tax=Dactylonectria macrodidyma TaxID=307937 RepID=A0A9P9E7C8_9HYPO|nr:heterokaryon incompatibility protein-domain-containing protein [Dactylonectria macrodidyma]
MATKFSCISSSEKGEYSYEPTVEMEEMIDEWMEMRDEWAMIGMTVSLAALMRRSDMIADPVVFGGDVANNAYRNRTHNSRSMYYYINPMTWLTLFVLICQFFATDEWIYPDHDAFPGRLLEDKEVSHYEASTGLCDRCVNIDLEITLSSLRDLKNDCPLCQILSRCLNKDEIKKTKMRLLEARSYVRICTVPDDSITSESIQPGLPVFLQSGSPGHFRLIKEWLRLCDEGECSRSGGCCPKPNGAMPSRVIDVGEDNIGHDKIGHDTVCLISTDQRRGIHYVALSHCWGDLTNDQKDSWCTTCSNEKDRIQGFLVEQLPATFQDAIRVTREIGKRYLWIDSLCIIQGEGGDWETEAKKMEAVFRNAYCTVAATSAEVSTKGFLNRPVDESNLQYVTVPNSSHGKVYVCTSIDDFPGDVVEGVLNKRAWVFQERALSRRTIHFTKRQTYFECGGGVRCETLTYMRNGKFSFRSDPEFPRSIEGYSETAQIMHFQSLFAEYSNLGLTNETDRPVAIDSLATALGEAFRTKVRYGIFERHLHRSLLWQRSQDDPMRRISFAAGQMLPSWSWMAYRGQIEYSEIRDAEWDKSVQFAEDILKARVKWLQDCVIKPEGPKHVLRDEKDNEVGHLCFDTQPGKTSAEVRCAIIGRETGGEDECSTQPGGRFERVGMGSIPQRFILFDGQDDTAQIL